MPRSLRSLPETARRRSRLGLLLLGGLALLGLGVGLGQRPVRAWYHANAAEQAIGRYDLVTARRHLAQSLRLRPDDARAQLLAARTARRQDAYADAERLLTKYEQSHGETDAGQFEWLLLGVQQGDLADTEGRAQSLLDHGHPDAPLIREALAKGYMNTARWARTANFLNRLLEREPDWVPALVLRGKCHEHFRRRGDARNDYERAVELAPDCGAARLCLAETLYKLGEINGAIRHYEFLRQREPANPEVLLGLARCRFESAELDQARQLLDVLLAAQPDHVAGLVERGGLAFRLRQLAEAETDLSRAVAIAPWHREAHRVLCRCLDEQGQRDEAHRCQERLRALEAQDADLGRLSLRFNHAPNSDTAVRYELGMWFLRNGQDENGLSSLFGVLLFDPRHRPTHAALADYFRRTGQVRRADLHQGRVKEEG
jgi:predicted Zn-dependent protease